MHSEPPYTSVQASAQHLAYLGDAVFELCVRYMLLTAGGRPVKEMNRAAKRYVSAAAQAGMYHRVYASLTEDERAAMKRGRNLHPVSRAKNAGMSDYRHATGLETLFGYLYTNKQFDRIREVFVLCVNDELGGVNG